MLSDTGEFSPLDELTRLTDEGLIEQYQHQNIKAFDLIVQRYKKRLFNFIFRMLGNYTEAEDITQETFIRVYTQADSFKKNAVFSTWLYTIATNLVINATRRKRKFLFFSLDKEDRTKKKYDDIIADSKLLPDTELEQKESQQLVQKAISSLSPSFRLVLILRDIEGLSYDEIAQITGLRLGTVKSRINRARLQLKDYLTPFFKSNQGEVNT